MPRFRWNSHVSTANLPSVEISESKTATSTLCIREGSRENNPIVALATSYLLTMSSPPDYELSTWSGVLF